MRLTPRIDKHGVPAANAQGGINYLEPADMVAAAVVAPDGSRVIIPLGDNRFSWKGVLIVLRQGVPITLDADQIAFLDSTGAPYRNV